MSATDGVNFERAATTNATSEFERSKKSSPNNQIRYRSTKSMGKKDKKSEAQN